MLTYVFLFTKKIIFILLIYLFLALLSLCCYLSFSLGSPGILDSKESACSKDLGCNEEDLGSIPGLEDPPGKGNGNLFQYSCLENPMGRRD